MDRNTDVAVADALRAAPNRTPAGRLARRTVHRSGRRRRIVTAAGIDVGGLSEHGRRILDWLVDWDEPTIDGIVQLIAARWGSRHGCGPAPRARRG
ncbi:MAG TPA: hypothetical protein VFH30_02350 [Acidimicrobiales bacterium]|nr:hypothetical protein [Acidimicrobiales bacterium]